MLQLSYFRYEPSLPAAIVVSVLFSLAFIGTTVQWLCYKSWVWIIMVLVSGSKLDSSTQNSPHDDSNTLLSSGSRWIYRSMYLNTGHTRQGYLCRSVLLDCSRSRIYGCCLLCSIRRSSTLLRITPNSCPNRVELCSMWCRARPGLPSFCGFRLDLSPHSSWRPIFVSLY
jgi:hypothetical protein